MAKATGDYWTITPTALFELINDKRRQLNRTPIDHGAMATRLALKSNVAAPGVFDFSAPKLKLTAQHLQMLEEIVNDQFDLYLKNSLARHCVFHSASAQAKPKARPAAPAAEPQPDAKRSKLKRLFGRD
jgi:hypothetical protein